MNIILMRHAEAIDEQIDPNRPLTENGRTDARSSAKFASEAVKSNSIEIFHSPKTRAKETALIIANKIKDSSLTESEDLLPSSSYKVWLDKISNLKSDIVIVSHLPFIGKLCYGLTEEEDQCQFKTASIKILSKKKNKWEVVDSFNP
jgi:phosphohistidine phosphatase